MKRYIMTAASVLMALTTFAQKELMVLVAESDSHETKVTFANRAEVSFWGQPQGEEQNGDLTITMTDVKGESTSFTMQAKDWKNFDKGFYISEQEGKDIQVEWDDVVNMNTPEAIYTEDHHFYSLASLEFDDNNKCAVTITGLKPNTTYYIRPYANVAGRTEFGSEKTFTTQWTISTLIAQDTFGSWYNNAKVKDTQGVFIVPTAEAWSALCNKYEEIFGDNPSETVQRGLTTEWFRHLTPAEVDLMKTYSVAYYDNCEDGEVYVVDRVCDEMIPNLLKAKADIDLTNPNLTYTKNCIVESVQCDESYGIERYVKTEPNPSRTNPQVGFNLPFMLLPNCIYNVSVTIAPNTEDVEDERPNKFQIYVNKDGVTSGKRIANSQTTTEESTDYLFTYGGQKLETFTFQIDTHDEEFFYDIIRFNSYITSRQLEDYSRTLRIAKITVSSVIDNVIVDGVEIVPMEEETEIAFNERITENTDLTSKVIDNVYVTLDMESEDGYDTEEKCVVLTSTVTEEQLEVISGKEVGEATVKENFNGLILEVPAGTGTVSIDAQTKGSRTLNIKMGTSAEQTFTQSERGVVEVSYTVEKDTYVYIYGAEKGNDARRRVSGVNAENGVLIYGIKWTGDTTDIDAVATANDGTYQIYTIDGTSTNVLQKGVNILRYPNGTTKKVFVK